MLLLPLLRPLALTLALAAGAVTGFAIRDLTKAPFDADAALGAGYVARVEPTRLTAFCPECEGGPMLDVQLGRQSDGTEDRVRRGVTTMAQLEAQCAARQAGCRIEGVAVEPAVGWLSTYRAGTRFAHTLVVLRDGDLLTMRSIAADSATARRNADILLRTLVPTIVGPPTRE